MLGTNPHPHRAANNTSSENTIVGHILINTFCVKFCMVLVFSVALAHTINIPNGILIGIVAAMALNAGDFSRNNATAIIITMDNPTGATFSQAIGMFFSLWLVVVNTDTIDVSNFFCVIDRF